MHGKSVSISVNGFHRGFALSLALVLFAIAAPVFAQGGFDHVRGTVAKVSGNVLTVRTTKGNVGTQVAVDHDAHK